ncbi:retrovirus-related Pol polyprotein from transposon TNT 1-94 [Trichonephila clavata]|uniref:Retrovirus-related Pol polyprotein from transposon TNT 1-94 n=1 Tax=Trichonephila clavata TaxID=2740835 RepID=A0A8X6M120_TRICU|nr:retrovirus-related Pol polyprotein from transposon TNT 1-94 [Trichonephila clavata]
MIKEVLSDGGGDVINLTVKSVLEKSGISSRMSMPYTPQRNEVEERENRTIVESAKSMIYAGNLPLKLWAEAVNTGEKDGYRIWIKDQNKVILSRDVIFQNEKSSYVPTDIQNSDTEIVKKLLQTPYPDVEKEIEEISCSAEDTEETLVQQNSRNLSDRPILKMPAKFDSFILLEGHIEPEPYKESMASEDSDKCTYDVCEMITNHRSEFCPMFPNPNECGCPMKKGSYSLRDAPVVLPNFGEIFAKILKGDYEGNITFIDKSSNKQLGCIAIGFQIEPSV